VMDTISLKYTTTLTVLPSLLFIWGLNTVYDDILVPQAVRRARK